MKFEISGIMNHVPLNIVFFSSVEHMNIYVVFPVTWKQEANSVNTISHKIIKGLMINGNVFLSPLRTNCAKRKKVF